MLKVKISIHTVYLITTYLTNFAFLYIENNTENGMSEKHPPVQHSTKTRTSRIRVEVTFVRGLPVHLSYDIQDGLLDVQQHVL